MITTSQVLSLGYSKQMLPNSLKGECICFLKPELHDIGAIAEKVETVLRRGIFNTRARDYYDIYILGTTQTYDIKLFQEALTATAVHRGSAAKLTDSKICCLFFKK